MDVRENDELRGKPTEDLVLIPLDPLDPKKVTYIGASLDKPLKGRITTFLQENNVVFDWTAADMPGIDPILITHRLNVDPTRKAVKQKKKTYAPDRLEAIKKEVEKLLKAGFIEEVQFPEWLANSVMVKKANGKWMMCIDFTDLNNAYTKNCYPLPRIDTLIDTTVVNVMLNFMDGFSGYNHIRMLKDDTPKNAGATYQRLVNKLFAYLIGKTMEVKDFEWIAESQDAFEQLKKYMTEGPFLAKPSQEDTLYLYLAVYEQAVSAILMKEEQKLQKSIYYVSKVLHGAELNYSTTEKFALSLITASRKLRPYFQAHKIEVLTDQPLRNILHSLKASGRLMKWEIELGEFDIKYKPRTAIKAQALADFVVECTINDQKVRGQEIVTPEVGEKDEEMALKEYRVLHFDGASKTKSSGVGLVFQSPYGFIIEYALKLDFATTNNETEYEALIAGLGLARATRAKNLKVCEDSKLVVAQFNGEFEAKDDTLAKYLRVVKGILTQFDEWYAEHVRREENTMADALSQFASSEIKNFPRKFREYYDDNSTELRFTSVADPQANGQAEVANRIILYGIKKRVERSRNLGGWVAAYNMGIS
ncbi:uncharacterized protein LOC141695434 [Apium graveolens]|uniref:uncharacterized protein LOC141695434 n=1 Tax=Apium graveolens TaxID=4045 RepID=UPI003D7B5AD3